MLIHINSVAQIKEPERPKFPNEQTNVNQASNYGDVKIGMHGDEVLRQANDVRRIHGISEPPTQEEILNGVYQKRQDAIRLEKQKILDEILNEGKVNYPTLKEKKIHPRLRLADSNSNTYKSYNKFYIASFNLLNKMLNDVEPLDIKQAVFYSEKARDTTLNWKKFESDIKYWKEIVLQLIQQEKLDPQNSLAINFCIQKLFSDTIKIIDPLTNKRKTISPFTYDFEDFYGEKDIRNYMVSKLLRTHSGQCHSMPLLYLILTQELGAEAFISHSPSHSFIMFRDGYGRYSNFETTSGYICSRDMYLETNLIKSEALKNGIFLRPTTLKESIAHCMVDLGSYFQKQFGNDDFVLQCGLVAKKHAPNNASAQILLENIGTAYMLDEAKRCGWPNENERHKYKRLNELQTIMADLQTNTDMMGYEEMPKDAYEHWLKQVEVEKLKRQKRN